jgi:hypothetical protein
MAANLDKSENSLTSVSTLTYLRGIDASGNSVKISTSDLASVLGVKILTGCVGVAAYSDEAGAFFLQPDKITQYYIAQAVGVWVQEGGKLLVVAKDQVQNTKWATSNVSGGTTAKGREAAIADMAGRANTDTIISTLGDNAPAAKYCSEYFPTNVTSRNTMFGAGRWWLPSFGELWMIWSHLLEINRIMKVIGGTVFNRDEWYWSSTEASAATAWRLYFNEGRVSENNKEIGKIIRPVSAFY